MVSVEKLGNGRQMAREVTLGPFWHTLAAPCNQDRLRESGIGILDFDESELNSSIAEFFDQVEQFALCW
jgi:hypothetical protein